MAKNTKTNPPQQPQPQPAPEQEQPKAIDWAAEGGGETGFENVRPDDVSIPFIMTIQKGSPEFDETHQDYGTKQIPDCKPGMLFNSVNREIVYDRITPMTFIPAAFQKLFQEWKLRDEGGGFVKSHSSPAVLTTTTRNEKNHDILPNGNQIVTTSYFYGFYLSQKTGVWERAVIPFTSTQLKKAKTWLNQMTSLRENRVLLPMFSHAYAIETVPETNEKGSWYGFKITLLRRLNQGDGDIIKPCREIARSLKEQKLLAAPGEGETGEEAY